MSHMNQREGYKTPSDASIGISRAGSYSIHQQQQNTAAPKQQQRSSLALLCNGVQLGPLRNVQLVLCCCLSSVLVCDMWWFVVIRCNKKVAGFDSPRHATENGQQNRAGSPKTHFGWFSLTTIRVRTAAMLGACLWAAVLLPVMMSILS